MKKWKVFITLCFTVMLLFCSSGCFLTRNYEIQNEEPEVDYGYMTINSKTIYKNRKIYSLEDMVSKFYKKTLDSVYILETQTFGDTMYLVVNHGSRLHNEGKETQYQAFDVSLLLLNLNTLRITEEVYSFPDISRVPIEKWNDTHPYFTDIIDENRMVMKFNNAIHVFNIQQKKITCSIDVYNDEKFQDIGTYNGFTSHGNIIVQSDKWLHYYELTGNVFTLHEFEKEPTSTAYLRDNYLYTYGFPHGYYDMEHAIYYDCFDVTTNKRVDDETFLTLREEWKADDEANHQASLEAENKPLDYTIDGKTYQLSYDLYNKHAKITDSNGETVILNEAFMLENSEKFNKLYHVWRKNPPPYNSTPIEIVNDKLFVGFSFDYNFFGLGSGNPTYIYEYNPETHKAYYVGFCDGGIDSLQIFE